MPITTYDYLTTIEPSDEELASVEVPDLDAWDLFDEELAEL